MDLLLFSNSTNHGGRPYAHALPEIRDFLAGVEDALFVPYALADHDAYTAKVADAFAPAGVALRGLHREADPVAAVASAGAVVVGGGNTFRLLRSLQGQGLDVAIREAVRAGTTRYVGASAGTNITAPTIRTTNDMPIVEPGSFAALGLVPFQINPHFIDADPTSTHMGETRETRLLEFLEENDVPVLGLREGTHLRVSGDGRARSCVVGGTSVAVRGGGPAIVFRRGKDPEEVSGDVSSLLDERVAFDG